MFKPKCFFCNKEFIFIMEQEYPDLVKYDLFRCQDYDPVRQSSCPAQHIKYNKKGQIYSFFINNGKYCMGLSGHTEIINIYNLENRPLFNVNFSNFSYKLNNEIIEKIFKQAELLDFYT